MEYQLPVYAGCLQRSRVSCRGFSRLGGAVNGLPIAADLGFDSASSYQPGTKIGRLDFRKYPNPKCRV